MNSFLGFTDLGALRMHTRGLADAARALRSRYGDRRFTAEMVARDANLPIDRARKAVSHLRARGEIDVIVGTARPRAYRFKWTSGSEMQK